MFNRPTTDQGETELKKALEDYGISFIASNPSETSVLSDLKTTTIDLYEKNDTTTQPKRIEPPNPAMFKPYFTKNNVDLFTQNYRKVNELAQNDYKAKLGLIFGFAQMKTKMEELKDRYEKSLEGNKNILKEVTDKSKDFEKQLAEKISRLKYKNYFLRERLIEIQALIDKIAIQSNEYNRQPNEETILHNKYAILEQLPNEIQAKLLDIRLNRENLQNNQKKPEFDLETKKNAEEILSKMKKGIEILDRMNRKDVKNLDSILEYYEKQP